MDINQQNGSEIARMIWIVGSPIIFTVGVFGNIMTVIVLNKRNKMTSSTIFLSFMAVADLFVMTIMLPRWWIIYMFGFDIRHIHTIVCKIQYFSVYVCGKYSGFLLAAVTIERAISTVKPYKVKTICTVHVAKIISIVLAFFLLALHGHVLVGINLNEVTYNVTYETKSVSRLQLLNDTFENITCSGVDIGIPIEFMLDENCSIASITIDENMTDEYFTTLALNDETPDIIKFNVCSTGDLKYGKYFSEIHQFVTTLTFFFISESIFFIGDFIIIRSLRKSRNLRMRMRSEYMRTSGYKPAFDNRATQITLTLVLVNIAFVLFESPALIYVMGLAKWVNKDTGMTETQEILWAIVNMLLYMNHAINFILYILSGSRFRRQVLETFHCVKRSDNGRTTGVSGNQHGASSVSTSYDLKLK